MSASQNIKLEPSPHLTYLHIPLQLGESRSEIRRLEPRRLQPLHPPDRVSERINILTTISYPVLQPCDLPIEIRIRRRSGDT